MNKSALAFSKSANLVSFSKLTRETRARLSQVVVVVVVVVFVELKEERKEWLTQILQSTFLSVDQSQYKSNQNGPLIMVTYYMLNTIN